VKTFSALSCHSYCNAQLNRGIGKNLLEPVEESMGDATVLSNCSLLRNSLPQLSGVLEHCRDEQTECFFSIFLGDSF
jgi:hypothetical protein